MGLKKTGFYQPCAKAFPALVKTDTGPVFVGARPASDQRTNCVSIEESLGIEAEMLQGLCSTLKTLVLSLRSVK